MLSSTCVLRKMSAARLILACVAAVAAGSVPAAAYDEHYESQPANQHSTLIDRNQTAIRDDTFAGWIRNLVFTGGGLPDPRVRDATLLFNQCYGGGMLDDLITAFIPDPHSSQIAWVGGSAAKHDEQSWGQGTPLETGCKADNYYYVDEPGEYWTNPGVVANAVLVDQMDTCSRAMIDCVNNARANDSEGVNGNRQETGQSLCRNLGEYITVEDTRCTKHYAILFAGNTNGLRFYYDIKGVRDKLVKCWGQPGANVSITVLYGDGQHKTIGGSYNSQLLPAEWNAQAATSANLQAAINNLAGVITWNDQFFFYATDHGGRILNFISSPPPVVIMPGQTWDAPYGPPYGEFAGMFLELMNAPTLTVDYAGQVPPETVSVWLNTYRLGYLAPTTTFGETVFPVPEPMIQYPMNQIQVRNNGPFPIQLNVMDFFTGGIGPLAADSPESAKKWLNGSRVGPQRGVVTAAFPGFFYIESEARRCGIRVERAGHGLSPGAMVNVLGTVQTNSSGERYVQADVIASAGSGEVRPVCMNNKSVGGGDWFYDPTGGGQKGVQGGVGLNNIGLLVRTFGRVGLTGPDFYYIDDGSNVGFGTPFAGVKVQVLPGVSIPPSGYPMWIVTGISSCYRLGDDLQRLILDTRLPTQ